MQAIARLYERYAEILPEGSERARAAATARSVAAMTGFLDHDRMAAAVAPAIEVVDHSCRAPLASRSRAELANSSKRASASAPLVRSSKRASPGGVGRGVELGAGGVRYPDFDSSALHPLAGSHSTSIEAAAPMHDPADRAAAETELCERHAAMGADGARQSAEGDR